MRRKNVPSGRPFFNNRLNIQAFADKTEYLLASRAVLARRDEHPGQLLPLLRERRPVAFDALFALRFREFVGLGEYHGERNAVHAEHFDELQVDLLGFEPNVRQYEQEVHLLALEHIVGDDFGELAAFGFRRAGVSVSGQIDQIPCVVDPEVVDEPCLAGRSRYFGQPLPSGEHVDERRFADVAAPDEGDVFQRVFGHLRNTLGTALEFGFVDLHVVGVCGKDNILFRNGECGAYQTSDTHSGQWSEATVV